MKTKIYVFTFTSTVSLGIENAETFSTEEKAKQAIKEWMDSEIANGGLLESFTGTFCQILDRDKETLTAEITETILDNEQDELQEYADSIVIEGEDGELKHYHGTFNDGYAILTDDETGDTATLFYPLLGDLTLEQVRAIEEYTGRPISEYYQIAVKYGKIENKKGHEKEITQMA